MPLNPGLSSFLGVVQIFFAIVIGIYFWNLLRSQQGNKVAIERESRKELDKLKQLREISLTEPLSERTRPSSFAEVIGQEQGLKALKAALCGPNPQHVLIYGPPGVGKTAAARLVLEQAKKNPLSPFKQEAKFTEMDATAARFDERGIADPLLGSVHDPIYQGAGPLGVAGIPQPKAGAVTKAHGGVLFLDEIGELHSTQMNKLLKVLEDRKVFLESAYYNSEDTNIPSHIHEIFKDGFPADFRLVGATTRPPGELPAALRSRCVEVFFRALLPKEVLSIAANAAKKIGYDLEDGAAHVVSRYADNGRDAVNIMQIAAGIALEDERKQIRICDVEWVVNSGQYSPRPEKKVPSTPQIGYANGLAVYGSNIGMLLEIEVTAFPAAEPGKGEITVTGVIDEEEMGRYGHVMRRKSSARESVSNVLTVLRHYINLKPHDFNIHVNFPGGIPVDGPSAGVSMAVASYSALTGLFVDNNVAMTGEVSIRGYIKPIGGVIAKIEAAQAAGAKKVIVPADNWQEIFSQYDGIEVVSASTLQQVLDEVLITDNVSTSSSYVPVAPRTWSAASSG